MTHPQRHKSSRPRAIAVARVYDAGEPETDDYRVLVDRMWPRGIARDNAPWHEWRKELAPSKELRSWFGHDPQRWAEFRGRYHRELADSDSDAAIIALGRAAAGKRLVLLYAARDRRHNNAEALAIELAQKWSVPKLTTGPQA